MSVFRDLLHADEPGTKRFALGLDLLQQQKSVVFRGLVLRLDKDEVRVDVVSSWQIDRITDESARRDLSQAADVLSCLLTDSPDLRTLVGARRPRFTLLADYHTGAIAICELAGKQFSWFGEGPPGDRKS